MIKISPSILSADFSRLSDELDSVKAAGADMIHLDVMDGHFVDNISFGLPVISALRGVSDMFFDVHLMISEPHRFVERFADAGADLITFHLEAADDVAQTVSLIKKCGKKAAVSLKPSTPADAVFEYLHICDMVLIMTVEPGHGGQKLLADMLDKVRAVKQEILRRGLDTLVQVDGGVTVDNAAILVDAGADVLVAGSAIFKSDDRKTVIDKLRAK